MGDNMTDNWLAYSIAHNIFQPLADAVTTSFLFISQPFTNFVTLKCCSPFVLKLSIIVEICRRVEKCKVGYLSLDNFYRLY